jgi:hypothetical protein
MSPIDVIAPVDALKRNPYTPLLVIRVYVPMYTKYSPRPACADDQGTATEKNIVETSNVAARTREVRMAGIIRVNADRG